MVDSGDRDGAPQGGAKDKGDPTFRNRLEGLVPEVIRRAFLTGVGAVFLTEDGIRKAISEMSLPKDAVDAVIARVGQSRDQAVEVIGREFRSFLSRVDLGAEIERLLTSLTFEIKTEIRFIPNEDRVRPNVKTRFRLHRSDAKSDSLAKQGESEK